MRYVAEHGWPEPLFDPHMFDRIGQELDDFQQSITQGFGSAESSLKNVVCHLPSVGGGGGFDGYAGVGGSLSGAVSINPTNGQISIGFDGGVGVGLGGGARGAVGKFIGIGKPSTERLPIVGVGLNANATAVAGPWGATGSYQLIGTNKGDWAAAYTGGADLSANANVSMHGQFNIPPLYNLGCKNR